MKETVYKNDKAVSPIIGTVLLIAITVTLAASVYTVLGSYFGGLPHPSPTASIKVVNNSSQKNSLINGSYTLSVTYVSNNVSIDDVKVQVTMGNTGVYSFSLLSVEQAPGGAMTVFNGTAGNLTVQYSGASGFLTSSSSIIFTESNGQSYISRISLIDVSTDSSMGSVNLIA